MARLVRPGRLAPRRGQCEARAKRQRGAALSDEHLELAGLRDPGTLHVVEVRQRAHVERELHRLDLSSVEVNLRERLELLVGTLQAGLQIADVRLDDRRALPRAGVPDRDGDRERLARLQPVSYTHLTLPT